MVLPSKKEHSKTRKDIKKTRTVRGAMQLSYEENLGFFTLEEI